MGNIKKVHNHEYRIPEQSREDVDTTSKTITDMVQHRASKVATAINKPLKSRVSSPIRALMAKRRQMVEKGDEIQRVGYAEMCKTIRKKARENIRKYNQEIIRETIVTSKNLRNVRRTQTLGEDRLITLLDK